MSRRCYSGRAPTAPRARAQVEVVGALLQPVADGLDVLDVAVLEVHAPLPQRPLSAVQGVQQHHADLRQRIDRSVPLRLRRGRIV
eukprot:1333070-Prorocentrum_lima.AAC.1